jgi:nitroreductase
MTADSRHPLAHLSRETLEGLVREAARAPSVHNVQPARWRFEPGGDVILFRALDRALPVADPTGHDVDVSLGAAFEGMAIALSRLGLALGAPTLESGAQAEGCRPVVRARVSSGGTLDPLAPQVHERRSYRGRFSRRGARELASARLLAASDVHVIDDALDIRLSSRSHDAATWRFESRREYHAEVWSWLRLSRRNPRYRRDGLNADCLALSTPERLGAMVLLHPIVFRLLTWLRVARYLIGEAGEVRSAIALVLFMPRRTDSAFDVGRRFYRLWLEITAAGLHAVPMSASVDDPATRAQYDPLVPADRRLANVLRVGHAPVGAAAESYRLPETELLV